ncbi:MAG: AI-2E family transporter, partial [Myxococcales bacterium]|nr:AI-2E family transporter [Myxococcales bacterium]
WSRSNTILGLLAAGGVFVGLFLLFLYPTVAHQAKNVSDGVPVLLERTETELVPWIEATFPVDIPDDWTAILTTYGDTLRAQVPTLTRTASAALGEVWSRLTVLLASAINVVMIPVFTFYFLRDFDVMRLALVDYIPAVNRDFLLERIRRMDEVVGAWFRGQVEVAVILAALYAAGLAVVFGWAGVGVGAGLAIGMLSGILNIVPYFGFVIGFSLSVLMVLLDWNGLGPLIGVLAVFGIVQGLEGYVITPRIVGEKVGLSPVTVIIALLLGGELLGIVGILLALPTAGIIRVLWPDVVAWYKASRIYLGDAAEPDAAEPVREDKAAGPSPS